VAPGSLDSEFGGGRTDEQEQRKMIGEHSLSGRIGLADDIGPLIAVSSVRFMTFGVSDPY